MCSTDHRSCVLKYKRCLFINVAPWFCSLVWNIFHVTENSFRCLSSSFTAQCYLELSVSQSFGSPCYMVASQWVSILNTSYNLNSVSILQLHNSASHHDNTKLQWWWLQIKRNLVYTLLELISIQIEEFTVQVQLDTPEVTKRRDKKLKNLETKGILFEIKTLFLWFHLALE